MYFRKKPITNDFCAFKKVLTFVQNIFYSVPKYSLKRRKSFKITKKFPFFKDTKQNSKGITVKHLAFLNKISCAFYTTMFKINVSDRIW